MKKILLISALTLSTITSVNSIQAADNRTEERTGFFSGLVIGALTGGPIGAIVGAVSGAWMGDKLNEAEKVDGLTLKIAEDKMQMLSLQESLKEQTRYLDQANLLLADQKAIEKKVAMNKQLITGLQVDLMFKTNSNQIEASAIDKIAPLVLMLEQFPHLELMLTGHGDVLGSKEGNHTVALSRAKAVKESFNNAGIEASRIHIVNSGATKAKAAIDDIDGRAFDRRVRISFVHTPAKAKFAINN